MSGNLVWRPRATTVALRCLRVQGSTSGGSNIRCPVAAGTHGAFAQWSQRVSSTCWRGWSTHYQDSRKGHVGCGKNGTRGAIFHKRRLLGEYILAVCKAGIWRMSDEMKAHAPKLII